MSITKKVSYAMIGRLINAFFNLLTLPYLARTLPKDDYGTYGQVLLTGEVALLLFSLGLGQVIFIQFADKKQKDNDVLMTNFLTNLILGAVLIVTTIVFSDQIGAVFHNIRLIKLVQIYSVSLVFQLIVGSLDSGLIHFNKVKQMVLVEIVTNVLRISSLFIAIWFYNSLYLVFVLLTSVWFVHFLLKLWFIPKEIRSGKLRKSLFYRQFQVGVPLGVTALVSVMFKRTDGIMVSNMLPTSDYAVFRMGAIEIPFLYTIFGAVTTIIMPEVTRLYADRKVYEIITLKRKVIRNTVALIYPTLLFVLIFSFPLLRMYLGKEYESSAWVFLTYNMVMFIRVNDYRDILIAGSRTKLIMNVVLMAFVLNIVLNYFLIGSYGYMGSVFASVFCFYLLAITFLVITIRFVNTKMSSLFHYGRIFSIGIASGFLAGILYLIYVFIGIDWVVLPLFVLYTIAVYMLILKNGWIDKDVLVQLTDKLPVVRRLLEKVHGDKS